MVNLDKLLYDVNVTCPVCSHAFKAQRVRKSALIPDGRDTDFYVRYRDFDPTDYSVWQCPACGYANAEVSFDDVNPAERHVLREALKKIQPLTVPRERNLATVMALFERAVYSAEARNSQSRAAGLYLRMAWVHRREGNTAEERTYLAKAFDAYLDAYQHEPFPIGKMSELTVLYLLGELTADWAGITKRCSIFHLLRKAQTTANRKSSTWRRNSGKWRASRLKCGPGRDDESDGGEADGAAEAAAAADAAGTNDAADAESG